MCESVSVWCVFVCVLQSDKLKIFHVLALFSFRGLFSLCPPGFILGIQSVPVPGSIYSKVLESKSEVVTSRTNISKKSCQVEQHNQVLQTKLSLRRRECFILKLSPATVSSLLVRPQGHKYTVMLIIIFNSYKEHVKTVSCIIISIILVYFTLLMLWSKGLRKPRLSC